MKCDKCELNISPNNFKRHYEVCDGSGTATSQKRFKASEGLTCQFCGKNSDTKQAHSQHERLCTKNKNRILNERSWKQTNKSYLEKRKLNAKKRRDAHILAGTATKGHLKDYLLDISPVCNRCGLTEWLGEPIPLDIHHKDGTQNNILDNVELLCPNCHRLTDNFGFKNKTHTNENKEKFRKLAKENKNFHG